MSKFDVGGAHFNYSGGFGKANKAMIFDPFAGRHETQIFETKKEFGGDVPKQELRGLGLSNIQSRDFMIDNKNPAEVLPPDEMSIRQINQAPDFEPMMRDLLVPGDYEPKDQVRLVQEGRANYIKQTLKFDNPDTFGDPWSEAKAWSAVLGDSAAGSLLNQFVPWGESGGVTHVYPDSNSGTTGKSGSTTVGDMQTATDSF